MSIRKENPPNTALTHLRIPGGWIPAGRRGAPRRVDVHHDEFVSVSDAPCPPNRKVLRGAAPDADQSLGRNPFDRKELGDLAEVGKRNAWREASWKSSGQLMYRSANT